MKVVNNKRLNRSIIVIIPAYNEEHSVPSVVKQICSLGKNIFPVVIDDGSSDESAIAAQKSGATVVSLHKNMGTGPATRVGLEYARKHKAGLVVLMDADGQHDPRYIPKLLRELDHGADVVIGSRYLQPTPHVTSLPRRLGTKIIALLISVRYRVKITDPTSGFRAMSRRSYTYLAQHYPLTFPEPEVVIALLRQGFALREVSTQMKPRMFGKSSIDPMRALYLMGYIVWKTLKR
jgi:glycosyltransferase involved in cell wall biosynthesis